MEERCFFGYGSLVNAATHRFGPLRPARLAGWRRAWRSAAGRPHSFLTVIRDPRASVDGVVAPVPEGDWAALDERERAYERHDVTGSVSHPTGGGPDVAVYAVSPEKRRAPRPDSPVLLSYIDVCAQGYLELFGESGGARFFDETLGWESPVLDDRAAPLYSRARRLSTFETAFVNDALLRLGVRPIRSGGPVAMGD